MAGDETGFDPDEGWSDAPAAQTTGGVTVEAEARFLEDESDVEAGRFLWAYRIRISNARAAAVQLLRRQWVITDARGGVQRVAGEGVIGEQPVIHPGEHYEYVSGAPLPTPSGVMSGRYEMATAEGESLMVEVPPFSLDSPHEQRTLN